MPIDTIIFDFGNVIAYFDYKIAAGRIGRTIGLNGSELMSKAMTLEFQPLLMNLESGRIDEIAFLTELKQRLQLPQPVDEIAADWADIFTANQPVHDLAHALKDHGYRLVLGSNTNAIHARQFQNQFSDLLSRFDALIMSHEVGAMKPAPLFYERCFESVKVEPGHCVFIDDMAENIEGAKATGLNALHYRDTETLKTDLARLGVVVT
jgi:putative hydrolase of the HAD superfamily